MLGDLQRQKADHYFNLIDEDNNDFIEPEDFQRRADRLAKAFDVSSDTERSELRQHLMTWWEHLSSLADENDDGRISREEWEMYWTRFKVAVSMGSNSGSLENLEKVAQATFQAIDRSGSGYLTEEEFSAWLSAWGVDAHESAFHQLDRNDNGVLTVNELIEATKEFYLSNDPSAPGNVLYGELPHKEEPA